MFETLIIGCGERAEKIYTELLSRPEYGHRFVGYVKNLQCHNEPLGKHLACLGRVESLPDIISACNIDEIIIAIEPEENIRHQIARHHNFDPNDTRAIGIANALENYIQTRKVISAIKLFVWIIGIMTIIAGIVGISNIMTIVIKERTKEIGIRKAVGAKPISIISLVLQESIFLTSIAGYIGVVLGIGLLELINSKLPPSDMFRNPTVDINLAIAAVIILILAGSLAGFFPARKAAQIKPVEVLRDE